MISKAEIMTLYGIDIPAWRDPVENHPLLDVLTQDPVCPVCSHRGTPISDDAGIAYQHDGRRFLCRVTPKILERP